MADCFIHLQYGSMRGRDPLKALMLPIVVECDIILSASGFFSHPCIIDSWAMVKAQFNYLCTCVSFKNRIKGDKPPSKKPSCPRMASSNCPRRELHPFFICSAEIPSIHYLYSLIPVLGHGCLMEPIPALFPQYRMSHRFPEKYELKTYCSIE